MDHGLRTDAFGNHFYPLGEGWERPDRISRAEKWDRVRVASHVTAQLATDDRPAWKALNPDNRTLRPQWEPALFVDVADREVLKGVWFTLSLYHGRRPDRSPYPIGGEIGTRYHRINVPLSALSFPKRDNDQQQPVHLDHDDVLLYKVGKHCPVGSDRCHVHLAAVLKGSREHQLVERGLRDASGLPDQELGMLNKENNAYFRFDREENFWLTPFSPTRRSDYRLLYVQLFFAHSVALPEHGADSWWDSVEKAW